MGFLSLVEQNSFIWKGMKGIAFVISLSNFSAAMATFKTFCKLAELCKKNCILIKFSFEILLCEKKIHIHQVGLIHITPTRVKDGFLDHIIFPISL